VQSQQTISSAHVFSLVRARQVSDRRGCSSPNGRGGYREGSKTIIRGGGGGGGEVKKDPEELDEEDGREIKEIVSWRWREAVRHEDHYMTVQQPPCCWGA
jgi:hypothetical protein